MNEKILLTVFFGLSIADCAQPAANVPQHDGAFLRVEKIGTGTTVLEAIIISSQVKKIAAGDLSKSGGRLKCWSETHVLMGKCGRIRFSFDHEDDNGRFWKAVPLSEVHLPGQGCQKENWQSFLWQELAR